MTGRMHRCRRTPWVDLVRRHDRQTDRQTDRVCIHGKFKLIPATRAPDLPAPPAHGTDFERAATAP